AIAEAVREAETELIEDVETLRAEAADALCTGLPLGDRPEKQAIEDAVLDRLRAAADEARSTAAAQWDAGFAERIAGVDALLPPDAAEEGEDAGEGGDLPAELKSLGANSSHSGPVTRGRVGGKRKWGPGLLPAPTLAHHWQATISPSIIAGRTSGLLRGPVRHAALRLQKAAPLQEASCASLAGRHRRSTGLAAWDGR
ncbi:hypothetical protein, partial [Novosphingobium sp.]|uniref:hypothetical protein n=1 Tax=Novosphingobium sp. TaxID=1874826 RepID=UPI0025E7F313